MPTLDVFSISAGAGWFGPKRSTTEQIFILRNILEQATEWREGLYAYFLDFEKALDSVHRESLWNIMRSFGIPDKMVRVIAGIYGGFECAVLGLGHKEGNSRQEISQQCWRTLISQMTLHSVYKFNDLYERTGRLAEEAARVGLKLNARKCKTQRTECASSRENIVVDGREMADVKEFTSPGAILDKEGGGSKDIMHSLQKACGAFQRLRRVWAARGIGRTTKIRLFKTLVRPVLPYGCEFWEITKNDERKLNIFQCQCLRRILRIRWQQRMTNKTVVELAEINDISCEVRRRTLNWLGHIFRREGENDSCTALGFAISVYASKLSNSLPLK